GHDEVRGTLRVALGTEATSRLATAKRLRHGDAPRDEDLSQTLPEPLVNVRELGGEVTHRAASDTVALALIVEDAVEQLVGLRHRIGFRVGEGGLEREVEEGPRQPVDDGVAELCLALEVVVEVALAHAALSEDGVERRAVVALEVDEAPGRVEDLIPRHGPFRALCIGQHGALRDSHGRALYQTVSTIASSSRTPPRL